MDDLMQDLLKDLEKRWRAVSAYEDLDVLPWTPGDEIPATCPHGCAVVDSGWHSMLTDGTGVDAHRRTVFCRRHSFARIYVISGAEAMEHGWSPSAG